MRGARIPRRRSCAHVFAPNDIWFRTGDLMRKDENGYFYFVDRIGDTFRWKGENVSTLEVAEAINTLPRHRRMPTSTASRFRAMKAAPAWRRSCATTATCRRSIGICRASLPDYARPVFVRVRKDLDMTATFKQRKIDLVKQGFDPDAIADPIYFNDPSRRAFVPLDRAVYAGIQSGQTRV